MEAEEEDDRDEEGGRRLLEFMFGNVDASGDVDADYLDEDERNGLSALAYLLAPSLADLDLADSPLAGSQGINGESDGGGFTSGDDEVKGDWPPLSPYRGDSAKETSAGLPSSQSLLFGGEDYDADDVTVEGNQATENQPEAHTSVRPHEGLAISDAGDPLESPVSAREASESKEGIDLPVLCMEDGKEVLRFSEIFGVQEPPTKVERRFLPWNPSINSRPRNLRLSHTVEDDEEGFLKSTLLVPLITRDLSREEDHQTTKVGGNGDSCLLGQPMKENSVLDESARQWEDGGPGFYPVDQIEWEDEIIWGSPPPSSSHGSGSCVISADEADAGTDDTMLLDQGFRKKPEEPSELIKDGRPTELPASQKMRTRHKGLEWLSRMLSLQNRDLVDETWLDQIVWDSTDRIPKPKPLLLPPVLDRPCHHDLSNDEFYAKLTGDLQRSEYFPKVIHSVPALKLQTMKPRLSTRELAHFHRPRACWYPLENEYASKLEGDLCAQGSIKIIIKPLGGDYVKLQTDAGEAVFFVKSKIAKKLGIKLTEKFKLLYRGKELEDGKSLANQCVGPHSLLHLIRSRIHLGSRSKAFRTKPHLSLMESSEERPLLLGNVGMGARICGDVVSPDLADESPFLQTNMYRAPLFLHRPSSSDYLLIRSAKGKLSLRRISKTYAVGQQELSSLVSSPATAYTRRYLSKRLMVHVYRQFCSRERPWIRRDELSLGFPGISEALMRKRLKHCAKLVRRGNRGCFWVKRADFRVPSEGEIRRILSPEDVCACESMQAGLYALKRLGISRLRRPIVRLSPVFNLLADDPTALAAASYIQRKLLTTPWNLCRRASRASADLDDLCQSLSHPALDLEGDTDLDSFAADLENLLGAEEHEERNRGVIDPRGAEDEEDEATEAALMSVILRDDGDDDENAMEIGEKESSREEGRSIFSCGACGQMGHMKTNRTCSRYRDEPRTSVQEKPMRLEVTERGNLWLKFKRVPEADAHPDSDRKKKITEISHGKIRKPRRPLILRLPARRKIILKRPNFENNVEVVDTDINTEEQSEPHRTSRCKFLA